MAHHDIRQLRRLGPQALKVLRAAVLGRKVPTVTQVNAAQEVVRRIARARRAAAREVAILKAGY